MPVGRTETIAAALVALAAVYAVIVIVRTAAELIFGHWYIGIPAAVFSGALLTLGWRWNIVAARRRAARLAGLRLTLPEIDLMGHTAFEYAVRDLMIRDGIDARRIGGKNDMAADVIGKDRTARTANVIVVQCKHTTVGGKVGARVIHEVNGTARPAHGADLAVVVTNGSFTRGARQRAAMWGIGLIGRDELSRWAGGETSVHRLLRTTWPGYHRRRLRRRLWYPAASPGHDVPAASFPE
ncbi:restriction endonuclease [Planomonospora sp. ID82291]|nr:restriction endonuclease [Planomonospora sp. ID82291]